MENKEVWKEIDFTDGKYSVSNFGNVRSNGFFSINHSRKSKRWVKPCVMKKSVSKLGYTFCTVLRKSTSIHRLVAKAFISNPLNKICINHIDGIKNNNFVDNLEWCTYRENTQHAISLGLRSSPPGFKILNIVSGDIYRSISEAAKENGLSSETLRRRLNDGKPMKNNLKLKYL